MKIKLFKNDNSFFYEDKEKGYYRVEDINKNYTYYYINIKNIIKEKEDYFIELKQDLYNVELTTIENKEHHKRETTLNKDQLKDFLNFETINKTYYYFELYFINDKITIQAYKTKQDKQEVFKYDEEVIKRKWKINYYFSQDITSINYNSRLILNISEKELLHFETLSKEIITRVILKNLINLLNYLNNNNKVIDLTLKEYLNSELLDLLKEVDLNFYLELNNIFSIDFNKRNSLIEEVFLNSKYKKLDKKNYFNNIFKQIFYKKEGTL